MNTFNNICSLGVAAGLAIFTGAILFSPGTLTALGWCTVVPVFAGSLGHITVGLYGLIPQSVKDKASNIGEEMRKKKPQGDQAQQPA